ncbi:hypothetical protein ILUMI_07549, partial [Ignelater luminosus]
SDYIPPRSSSYNCKIDDNQDSCNKYWINRGPWTLRRSVLTTLRAVTDQRWEGIVQ